MRNTDTPAAPLNTEEQLVGPITHGGSDRGYKLCKCSACGVILFATIHGKNRRHNTVVGDRQWEGTTAGDVLERGRLPRNRGGT
jgi:hypothetical protein